MGTDRTATIRIAPGHDRRDEPNGQAIPLGIVFELEGPEGRVAWSINSGWVHRPVLTDRLQDGPQERGSQPGVDHALAHGFPQSMTVFAIHAGANSIDEGRWLEEYDKESLLDALTSDGSAAVFSQLAEVYRTHLMG